jgi:tetratricopeptide (TPR) repeat protein
MAKQRHLLVLAGVVAIALLGGGLWYWFRALTPTPLPGGASSTAASPIPVATADRAIKAAQVQIAREPQKVEGYLALASAFMRKARESGDTGYYLRAEATVREALTQQAHSYEALRIMAWIQLGKHEFREALLTSQRLREQNPEDPLVYGLLGDASLELGDYTKAVEAFQQMLDRRPGLPAYSRAAHMRALHGDLEGATELMATAVRAGNPKDPEPLAWAFVQYGNLHLQQGHVNVAEAAYEKALEVFPNYYVALAALGQVRAGQARYEEAIGLLERAVAIIPAPDIVSVLGDLYAVTGRAEEAERQYALVEYIERVNALNQVTYNRQLALFYADHDREVDEAVTLAETELRRRQDIYSYDALAWAYYKAGRLGDAAKAMRQALRLGTQEASLLFHAGMIAHGLGQMKQAREYLRRALDLNPQFSILGVPLARKTLAELERSAMAQRPFHES